MRVTDSTEGGWSFVADSEAAPSVLAALLELDAADSFTQTDVAEVTDVPLKTLYLDGLLDEFVDLGVLVEVEPADGRSETEYRVAEESELLDAAAAFDDAYRNQRL